MKKLIIVLIAAIALAGAAAAQTQSPAPGQNAPAQTVTISGNLALINGVIGIKANGTSYYVPRLRMLVGFVKEVQEGAAVKLEGYAYPISQQQGYSFFAVTKLTIAGRDYDLGQEGFGPMGGRGGRGLRGGMRGWGQDGNRGGMMGGGPRW